MQVLLETRCKCRRVIPLREPTDIVSVPFLEAMRFEPNTGLELLNYPTHRKFLYHGETDETMGMRIYREEIT